MNNYKRTGNTHAMTFFSEDEDEVKYVIKTGHTEKHTPINESHPIYMVVTEDAYRQKLGDVELMNGSELKLHFGIDKIDI